MKLEENLKRKTYDREYSHESGDNRPEQQLIRPNIEHPLSVGGLRFGMHAEEGSSNGDHCS